MYAKSFKFDSLASHDIWEYDVKANRLDFSSGNKVNYFLLSLKGKLS